MDKPAPNKNAHCHCCHEIKPLLMPIGFIPGWPFVSWSLACLKCRLNHRYERAQNHPKWGSPAETWRYAVRKSMRDGYLEFLDKNPDDET